MASDVKAKVLNNAVIVVGHPRSGTSLVCQLLESAGVDFPSDFDGDEYNIGGYYEMEESKRLSKQLIEKAMTVKNTVMMNKIVDRLNECEDRSGLKLVRIPAIFFYRHIARELKAVFIFRNPADVKASLYRRGISSFTPGWFDNNNALIAAYENIEESFITSYETLIAGGEKVKKLFSSIGLEIDLGLVEERERTQQKSRVVVTPAEEKMYRTLQELEEECLKGI